LNGFHAKNAIARHNFCHGLGLVAQAPGARDLTG